MAALSSAGASDLPHHPAVPAEVRYGLTAESRRAAWSGGRRPRRGIGEARQSGIRTVPGHLHRFLAEVSYTLRLAREPGYLNPYEAEDKERLRGQSS
ncbi:MAG: hypothetical protein AMS20_02220 [Gemmatimonas sp. SG8_28]|nr:MAG: hypothetical protein AMS20_02220 [Gemmatimonas sp. SG8_28]